MLQVEAVVNPTNESLSDKNPISLRLYEVAGPELRDECKTQVGSELKNTSFFPRPLIPPHMHNTLNRPCCGNAIRVFLSGCRTGEARITGGYQLAARY